MKKIVIIALGLMVIISCKKEETSGPQTFTEYIVGNWNVDDIEVKVKLNLQGTPLSLDGESLTTSGFYKFNSDKTFSYDWTSDVVFTVPLVLTDTIVVAQDGNGTYKVVDDNKIEMLENGATTVYDVKSKSPTLMIVELEQTMDLDSLGMVDIEAEVVLSK